MAKIKVNTEEFVKGRMSLNRTIVGTDENGEVKLSQTGILETHKYFEEISILESERYYVTGVTVTSESFGTNDYNISYAFNFDNLVIKEDLIPVEIQDYIEDLEYKDEKEQYYHSSEWVNALNKIEEILSSEEEVVR